MFGDVGVPAWVFVIALAMCAPIFARAYTGWLEGRVRRRSAELVAGLRRVGEDA